MSQVTSLKKVYAVVWTGIRHLPKDGHNFYLFDNEAEAQKLTSLLNSKRGFLRKLFTDEFIIMEYKIHKKVIIGEEDGDHNSPG